MKSNRRDFLAIAGSAGLAAWAAPAVLGAEKSSKQYRTALVGTGWWGMNIVNVAVAAGQSDVVALCDVDENQLTPAVAAIEKKIGRSPRRYKDYRELLQKEKPEIVIVATPDHWHPLITIAACGAGAHVYVEKPIGHTLLEGRAMVNAARASQRVVQVGTHRRVSPHNVSGMEFLKSGRAGKIGMVRAFVHYGGGPDKPRPNEEPPKGLDWDFWCGPAPVRPFNRRIHPRGFRGFLDYANGTLGDWGIHWMDQVLWWAEEQWPKNVFSTGGRPIAGPVVNDGRQQTGEAPDHQVAVFQFDSFTLEWEHRQFAANNAEKTDPRQPVGCYFYGTEGTFHMSWLDGWTFYPVNTSKPPIHQAAQLDEPDGQNIKNLWADFLKCIQTGERPVCDIEAGHRSTSLSLLGMLSLKLGRSVKWDGQKERIPGDEEANKLLRREYREPWKYPEVG
jgi:predicted dehydrogenase